MSFRYSFDGVPTSQKPGLILPMGIHYLHGDGRTDLLTPLRKLLGYGCRAVIIGAH